MARQLIGKDVFQAAYDRLAEIYKRNHRVVIAFSGGKDSTACLEMAILVARDLGRLPVEVCICDEEIAYPGLYEFAERTANRPEVDMNWLVLNQPGVNAFNRAEPYFWIMDPQLDPEDWVRKPPSYAKVGLEDNSIVMMINYRNFPVEHHPSNAGWDWDETRQCLVNVLGLRAAESARRLLGLHSSGGYMTRSTAVGTYTSRPLYDWSDGDVWKFLYEMNADYCKAYDVFLRMGVKRNKLRLGPPTISTYSVEQLKLASKAWPHWWDKVCERLPGVRLAAQFGSRVCKPYRRKGETWEDCYRRENLGPDTPDWIRERSQMFMDKKLKAHAAHATSPFPDVKGCISCGGSGASWKSIADVMFSGDPQGLKTANILPLIHPEFFRKGAGSWAGGFEHLGNIRTQW